MINKTTWLILQYRELLRRHIGVAEAYLSTVKHDKGKITIQIVHGNGKVSPLEMTVTPGEFSKIIDRFRKREILVAESG